MPAKGRLHLDRRLRVLEPLTSARTEVVAQSARAECAARGQKARGGGFLANVGGEVRRGGVASGGEQGLGLSVGVGLDLG